MKKNVTILSILAACTAAFAFASCNRAAEPCEHGYKSIAHDEEAHWYVCAVCGEPDGENKTDHSGGVATCTEKARCATCGTAYGETDENAHVWGDVTNDWADDYSTCTAEQLCERDGQHSISERVDTVFTDGVYTATFTTAGFETQRKVVFIHATDMTAEQLNAAVLAMLENGDREIKIILAPDAPTEMITAIRRAICDAEGVEDGSVHLTLEGITAIPDNEYGYKDGLTFGARWYDENGGHLENPEYVKELVSVTLPDVVTVGKEAFWDCENLTYLTAPKVQTVAEWAFGYTGLTSLELPNATTLENNAFYGCGFLKQVKLPKATTLSNYSLDFYSDDFSHEVIIYLTAEGVINANEKLFYLLNYYEKLSKYVNLVLNLDKKNEVTFNTDGTATWNGFTVKSIRFTCANGVETHTYETVSNNGDGTHSFTCSACDVVSEICYGGEASCTAKAICEACGTGYGEFALHAIDNETGYCQFGCGEFVAAAKVTLGETITYYETLDAVDEEAPNGATITLLKEIAPPNNDSIGWSVYSFTLDLNGYNFDRGGYELYLTGDGIEVSLVNTAANRAKIRNAFVRASADKFTVGKNVDIQEILIADNSIDAIIDLSSADFESVEITVGGAGFNVSNIQLGGYAVYDANDNVVTGELVANQLYTIKAA